MKTKAFTQHYYTCSQGVAARGAKVVLAGTIVACVGAKDGFGCLEIRIIRIRIR